METTNMKQLFLFVVFFVFCGAVLADVQINEIGTCHIPQDQNDGGMEIKTVCDKAIVSVKPNGDASGYATYKQLLKDHLIIDKLDEGQNYRTDKYDDGGGVPCNINTENNTTYTSADWNATVIVRRDKPGYYDIEVHMNCHSAAAQ